MYTAHKQQTSLVTDDRGARLVTEASSLEFSPGNWPQLVAILDDDNEGFLFRRAEPIDGDSQVGFNYRSNRGMLLVVFND
jgi:hypothetical protein